MNPPTVMYLTAGEVPDEAGPYGSQVLDLVDHLNDSNLARVFLVAGTPVVARANTHLTRAFDSRRRLRRRLGDRYRTFALPGTPRSIMYPGNQREDRVGHAVRSEAARRAFRSIRPDVIHCRSYSASRLAIAWRLANGWRTPILFDARSHGPEEGAMRRGWSVDGPEFAFARQRERELVAAADRTIALSSPMKDYFDSIGAQRTDLVYTLVKWQEPPAIQRAATYAKRFCYVGMLQTDTWHDPRPLFDAFHSIVSHRPDASLTIVTRSPHEPLRQLAITHFPDVARRLELTSADSSAKALELITEMDVGLQSVSFPDTKPGQRFAGSVIGTKVAEYLCAGLSVLVDERCIAAAQLVGEHRVGIGAPFGSIEAPRVLAALDTLVRDQERIASLGRRLFGIEAVAPAYADIYRSASG